MNNLDDDDFAPVTGGSDLHRSYLRGDNQLASELLMPKPIVQQVLPDLPVVSHGLRRLAKQSKVSELAAAIRVCNLAEEIGLNNALVVLFDDDDSVRWQWSQTLEMPERDAFKLFRMARNASPEVLRVARGFAG